MRGLSPALLTLLALVGTTAIAEIPYATRAGIEEVDYAKLNPIEGFKLPDSGQFRETTYVFGEDRDYTRNPMGFTVSEDEQIVSDNNTGLMWERHLNWRWDKTTPPKGEWRPQDVFTYAPVRRRIRPCRGSQDWSSPGFRGHSCSVENTVIDVRGPSGCGRSL